MDGKIINILLVPLSLWVDDMFWQANYRRLIEEEGYVSLIRVNRNR